MQTHEDFEHRSFAKDIAERWMEDLKAKAERTKGLSKITAGDEGEPAIARWKSNGIEVCQRADDEHGILRMSIGGGPDCPVKCDYLVFRGDHGKCVDLLRKALHALESGPLER